MESTQFHTGIMAHNLLSGVADGAMIMATEGTAIRQ
jgi:hypothetical protein